jgi:hypothetical protein
MDKDVMYTILLGVIDGFLVAKAPAIFAIKNIAVPILDMMGIYKPPAWLKDESYAMLGLLIGLFIGGKLGWA